MRDFLLLFFSNMVKKLHFIMAVFIFCFGLESLKKELNNYFVQNVYYITLRL